MGSRGIERRRILPVLTAVVAGFMLPADAPATDLPGRKPNVIVILADDLGYADVGFQGCKDIRTPHVDRLAESGVRCTAGYVSSPVCGPTRAGLLTGRYQQRFGFEYNAALGPRAGLPESETTLADLLQSAGYATGVVGKWHLGKQPPFHPMECGFDEFYGFLGGGRPYFPIQDGVKIPFSPNDPLVRNRSQVGDPEYLTDAFGREAVDFIERHRGEPFFLYLSFNAVHVPLQATARYKNRFPEIENAARRTYAAMVSAMDDAIGLVQQKLRATALERDTLLFFLSDNGGHPMANAARNLPLRGQKSTVYEGGIRVPFVVTWAGHIPAGLTYAEPVISLDIFPTTLAAAGVPAPGQLQLDGVNLLPFITGKRDHPPHETLCWRYGYHRAIRHGNWKLTTPAGEESRLYDLSHDIAETTDLSAERPQIVEKLDRLYTRWDSELLPPRWPALFMKDAPGPPRKTHGKSSPSR